MMREIALCGVVPVTITFFQLELSGQLEESWYMIILSVITIVAASVAAIWPYDVRAGYEHLTMHPPLVMLWCSNTHPATYCLDDNLARVSGISIDWWNIALVAPCAILGTGIVIRHCCILVGKSTWMGQFYQDHKTLANSAAVIIGIVLCLPLANYGYYLGTLARQVNKDDWGFGQIVAITLWVPILIEFAAIFGE